MSEIDKVPIPGGGTGVNQPETPYGDIATLDRLKKELGPPGGGVMPPAGEAPPSVEGATSVPPAGDPNGSPGESPLPGLPASILNPTERPEISPTTPLQNPQGPGPSRVGVQQRLHVITTFQMSDSPIIREFADMAVELLVGGEDE